MSPTEAVQAMREAAVDPRPSYQARAGEWLMACFGSEISRDRIERNHRFLEEALELVQSCGCSQSEAHQLVNYVYGRPAGEKGQEVGGVMNTLAALCLAHDLDMDAEADLEIERCWNKIDKIRAKQAAKPKHSPLPEATADDLRALLDDRDALKARVVELEKALGLCGCEAGRCEQEPETGTVYYGRLCRRATSAVSHGVTSGGGLFIKNAL